jgi:AraC-like DNA-binding protein
MRRAATSPRLDQLTPRQLAELLVQRTTAHWNDTPCADTTSASIDDSFRVMVLCATLVQHVSRWMATRSPSSGAIDETRDTAWVDRIQHTICTRYADPLTLASLARLVGREPREVASTFVDRTGQSVHAILTSVRMAHAMLLIVEGDKIESVGLAVGYRSKKNFYRQFRAMTGLTPTMFRTMIRVNGEGTPSRMQTGTASEARAAAPPFLGPSSTA